MLRVGVLDGGMEVESLKANPTMRTYDGPAAHKWAAKPDVKGSLAEPLIKTAISAPLVHDLSKPSAVAAA